MISWILDGVSTYAGDIDLIIFIVLVLGGAWLIATEALFFWFCFKYKAKPGQKAQYISGEKHEHNKYVHWAHYAVIACDVVIIVFAVIAWYNVKQKLPPADETVRVIGQQWAWTFVHPGPDKKIGTEDDVTTLDELHIKANTTYHYKLESQDVLHDFSVPVFRLKQDAIPGRVITGWFNATKTGVYDIQCAEMCGIGHGIMGAKLFIETEEQHNQWLAEQAAANSH